MRQILEGVAYIHQLEIVHRDLKPQNVLMRSFHQLEGAVKIADFGLGMQGSDASTDGCGTMIYMAPEQLTKSIYRKVREAHGMYISIGGGCVGRGHYNVYAAGGKAPAIRKGGVKGVVHGQGAQSQVRLSRVLLRVRPDASPPHRLAKDFVLRLCCVNVDFRYSANTALRHPWITRYDLRSIIQWQKFRIADPTHDLRGGHPEATLLRAVRSGTGGLLPCRDSGPALRRC